MARTKGIQVHPAADSFMRQAHQIARAAYCLPGTQKSILSVLVSQVQVRNNGFELLEVEEGEMLRVLEIADSHYEFMRTHMLALKEATLRIDTGDGYKLFSWVDTIEYVKSRKVFKFKLGEDLLPFILNLKEQWAKIKTTNLNRLTGKYAHRLYDLVMSEEGHRGKDGNGPGEWFVDVEFSYLRILFVIGPKEYKRTGDFRTRVLDDPIREVNNAGVGLYITADYDRFRRGRKLLGVRLKVKETRPGEPRNVTPTQAENEDAALKALNQELFDRLKADEPVDMFGGEFAREGNAWQRMLKHPDFKPLPAKPKKRGRPRKEKP